VGARARDRAGGGSGRRVRELLAPGSDTSSTPATISSDLAELTATLLPDTPVRVIVGSNGPMSVVDRLRLQTLITSWGGTFREQFDSYDGYVADCPADRIDDLARDVKTFHMAPDRTVRASMNVALPTIQGTSEAPAGQTFNVLGAVQIPIDEDRTAAAARSTPERASRLR
jgi:hypothetical protein